MTESAPKKKNWISLGEIIALAALIISAAGLWLTWKSTSRDRPTQIVEQRQPIPLTLRGVPEEDGRSLAILPVEQGHGLQSLTVAVNGRPPIEVGSDGRLSASDLERALGKVAKANGTVTARIDARYVESGTDRRSSRDYRIRYRWEGGGLFSGRSLRISGLSR